MPKAWRNNTVLAVGSQTSAVHQIQGVMPNNAQGTLPFEQDDHEDLCPFRMVLANSERECVRAKTAHSEGP